MKRTRLGLALAAASACSSTLQTYPGPPAARENVALLEPAPLAGTRIVIDDIDGVTPGRFQRRLELLPGTHRLRGHIVLGMGLRRYVSSFELTFPVRAAMRYQILGERYDAGPRLWIVDEEFRTIADLDPGLPGGGAAIPADGDVPVDEPAFGTIVVRGRLRAR